MKKTAIVAVTLFIVILFGLLHTSTFPEYEEIEVCKNDNPNIVGVNNNNATLLLADSNYKQKKELGECNWCLTSNNLIIVFGPSVKYDNFEDEKFKYKVEREYINIYNKDGKYICGQKNCIKSYSNYRYDILFDGENSIVVDSHTEKTLEFNCEVEEVLVDKENKYYFVVKDNGYCGIIDKDNNVQLPLIYNDIDKFVSPREKEDDSSYTLNMKKDKKYGICKQNGEIIFPVEYDEAYGECSNNRDNNIYLLFKLKKDGKEFVSDSKGNKIDIYSEYDDTLQLGNNLYRVKKNGKLGLVTLNNEELVPLEYDLTSSDRENKILIGENNNNGKLSTDVFTPEGNLIDTLTYDDVEIVNDKVAIIRKDKKYGVVSIKNEELIPAEYDLIRLGLIDDCEPSNFFTLQNGNHKKGNEKYGVATIDGKVILEPEYSYVNYLEFNDFITARKNDKGYLFDKNGNVLIKDIDGDIIDVFMNKDRYYAIVYKPSEKQQLKDITKAVLG